jgi:hypothetical protein
MIPFGPTGPAPAAREAWTPPAVMRLPPLTELTLTTGEPIPGSGETTGGSTVVP